MQYKVIKTESDYKMMLDEAYRLMDAKENTSDGDKLELVALLIEKYEEEHYPIAPLSVKEKKVFDINELLSQIKSSYKVSEEIEDSIGKEVF